MFKLFFKYVIPLTIFLAIFLVGYNYFFGTPEEQKQSQRIIAKFTDLGGEVYDMLRSEKTKYDDGKYDEALAKISERIDQLKQLAAMATENKQQLLDQVEELDKARDSIQSQLNSNKMSSNAYGVSATGDAGSSNYGASSNYRSAAGAGDSQNYGSSQQKLVGATNPGSQDIAAQIEALAQQAEAVTADFKKQVRK